MQTLRPPKPLSTTLTRDKHIRAGGIRTRNTSNEERQTYDLNRAVTGNVCYKIYGNKAVYPLYGVCHVKSKIVSRPLRCFDIPFNSVTTD
jgi:hypothetical protein